VGGRVIRSHKAIVFTLTITPAPHTLARTQARPSGILARVEAKELDSWANTTLFMVTSPVASEPALFSCAHPSFAHTLIWSEAPPK